MIYKSDNRKAKREKKRENENEKEKEKAADQPGAFKHSSTC